MSVLEILSGTIKRAAILRSIREPWPSLNHRHARFIKYFGFVFVLSLFTYVLCVYGGSLRIGHYFSQSEAGRPMSGASNLFMQFLSVPEDRDGVGGNSRIANAKAQKIKAKKEQDKEQKQSIKTLLNPQISLLNEDLHFPPTFYTYHPDKRPIKFILQVFAWRRSESLKRLCQSLKVAKYFGLSVDIHFHVDASPATSVLEYIEGFHWPFGQKHRTFYDKTQGIIHVKNNYFIDNFFEFLFLDDAKSVASQECL